MSKGIIDPKDAVKDILDGAEEKIQEILFHLKRREKFEVVQEVANYLPHLMNALTKTAKESKR